MLIVPLETELRNKHIEIYDNTIFDVDFENEIDTKKFEGLWRSEGGSIYVSNGEEFICVSVHSSHYIGWVGKCAIKNIHKFGQTWVGLQAFRNAETGILANWVNIELVISEKKVTKYFPKNLSESTLSYGHIEHYYRIKSHRDA